jgi:hypothetical protein
VSKESVTIGNLAAGRWVVLVDGFAVPAGTTTFNYVDAFVNAAYGSVSVTDANALRAAGASWTVPGSVTADAAAAAGHGRSDGRSWLSSREMSARHIEGSRWMN